MKSAFDSTSTFGKSKDCGVECNVAELTNYCNKHLFVQHGQINKHFVYRQSKTLFYVKRDYLFHDTTPQEDLDLSLSVCQKLFDTVDIIDCGLTSL